MPTRFIRKEKPFMYPEWGTFKIKNMNYNNMPHLIQVYKDAYALNMFELDLVKYITKLNNQHKMVARVAIYIEPVTNTTERIYLWEEYAPRIYSDIITEPNQEEADGKRLQFGIPIFRDNEEIAFFGIRECLRITQA